MAQLYSIDNLAQLSHSAGQIPFIYDKTNDVYRPLEQQDLSFANTAGSTSFDAFGRMRVSEPMTLFDSTHRYSDNNLWSIASGVGGGSVFNANQGLIDLNITSGSGSYIYRETTKVFAYQPGKSLLALNTFVMSSAKTGLTQRVGYFGVDNGMFVELSNSTLSFVERSLVDGTPVKETRVSQANWNGDKLDGNGASGLTLDISKAQILWMDIEWLGLGSVRMGFVINGQFILCHTFHHANVIASTYITTASLPLRYEIFNTASTTGSSTLKQICSSVISEGGYELRGSQQAVSSDVAAPYELITSTNTDYPVITIRLKASRLDAIVILTALSLLPTTTSNFKWKIIAGGTTSGGSGNWISAGSSSAVEYKQDATSISGGRTLAAGFINQTNQSRPTLDILKEALFKFQLERNGLTNTPFELTLAISAGTASGGNPAKILASMDWEEISR